MACPRVLQERGAGAEWVVSVMYERLNTLYNTDVDVAYAGMKGFGVEQRAR
jgi:hypothetical protein